MRSTFSQDRASLEKAGIFLPSEMKHYADDAAIQPGLVTQVNAGIPAYLANILDPKVIEVLLTPTNAVKITGERGMGSWTTMTAQFPVMEHTGQVSSYGDFDNNGATGINLNWVPRQQYMYQATCVWGDHELEMNALAKIDYANGIRQSKVVIFNKFQNQSYFFGVKNLQNFGLLNDPSLFPSITPTTKTAGGTSWSKAKPEEMVQDVVNIYAQLVAQTGQLITQDDDLRLAFSGFSSAYLNNTNQYGLSAVAKLKEIFPKLEIVSAPEYTTATGELVQLIAPKLMGQETLVSSFADKMRAFPVIRHESSFTQKFSAGTWGCIIKQPVAIASMLGI